MSLCKVVSTPFTTGAKFSKEDGSPKANGQIYRSIIGSLLYLFATKPDIMFATWLLSRFMQEPSQIHFTAAKRIPRYVKGTLNFSLTYVKQDSGNLIGHCDSDWVGSLDDSKTTNHALWLRKRLLDLGFEQSQGTLICVDNLFVVSIAKNPVQYRRTTHIRVKYHALKGAVKENEGELKHCKTENQLADIFTKSLGRERFEHLRSCLGVQQIMNHGAVLKY
ncbi:Retrotransposon protein, unclassified, putative [Theobroma cacao]|uniref:Retrotransposon protein, unclassified, putative n=1 Tax=Theobroma cacao TaxID=3641 RepID=A0A061DMM7_THECC|nr:Retrotransposon protein, unclassified, putative [Theobroma cacao]